MKLLIPNSFCDLFSPLVIEKLADVKYSGDCSAVKAMSVNSVSVDLLPT